MFEKPTPLREALREAVLIALNAIETNDGQPVDRVARDAAIDRALFLIEQIPIVFEARETDSDED